MALLRREGGRGKTPTELNRLQSRIEFNLGTFEACVKGHRRGRLYQKRLTDMRHVEPHFNFASRSGGCGMALVGLAVADGVAHIKLNRPEVANTFDLAATRARRRG